MSTDKNEFVAATDTDDVEGHGIRGIVAANDTEDDVEGHGIRSVHPRATDDEDDVQGHITGRIKL